MDVKLGLVEARFADIIWVNEPVSMRDLLALSERELNWKRTTTYTVLKKLCDRGIFSNDGGTVTSVLGKEEYYARHSEQYVEENFGGSLPAFLAAFSTRKKLSDKEYEEMCRLIQQMRG